MGLLQRSRRKFQVWLFEGRRRSDSTPGSSTAHKQHPWWQVMCLTGVDYFSTLGYQPGIAFLAAGALSPIATLVLIFLTLFGALPMYRRVAAESPHGDGSISMLENLLSRWKGKLFVLALLGFATTSFIITITLSAADATAHIVENPFVLAHLDFLHHRIAITLILITALGAIFLRGFKEAIGIAVFLVAVYLALNLTVVAVGFYEIVTHPTVLLNWKRLLFDMYPSPFLMIGTALFVFPKLALGLSGFETGVVVMPLVKGDINGNPPHIESQHLTRPGESPAQLSGRIYNTRKLLTSAALIMSFLLLASSICTTLLIPPEAFRPETEFQEAGRANAH